MVFGNVSLYLLQDVQNLIYFHLCEENIFTAIKSYFQSVANSTVTTKRLQLSNLISHITLLDV